MSAAAAVADPAGGAVPVKSGRKKKLLILVAAVLVVLLAAGGGTVVYLKKKAAAEAAAAEEDEGTVEKADAGHGAAARGVPIYLPLDPFIVNLADKEADRYAQIGITLELDSSVAGDQMKIYMPAIRSAILMVIAHKTSRELLDRAGKDDLAAEVMREAVRPLGIEIATPLPVADAASAASAVSSAQDDAPAKQAKKRKQPTVKNPILHVNFSSFIIQ